jgi:acetyltransferase-like isoleucine patch superfamily enzyme
MRDPGLDPRPDLDPGTAGAPGSGDRNGPAPAKAPGGKPAPHRRPPRFPWGGAKRALKWLGYALGLTAVAVPAFLCRLESWLSGREEVFLLWAQALALAPGLPGKYLRKCFYYLTLESCPLSCDVGFLSYFTDRRVRVGERVYIGTAVSMGAAVLGDGALIGSRASVLTGAHQHRFEPDGKLTPFERDAQRRTRVGEETWIGEAAVVMADVGSRCIVAAGSVVSSPVTDGCIVGGNPARFVGRSAACDAANSAPAPGRPGP